MRGLTAEEYECLAHWSMYSCTTGRKSDRYGCPVPMPAFVLLRARGRARECFCDFVAPRAWHPLVTPEGLRAMRIYEAMREMEAA